MCPTMRRLFLVTAIFAAHALAVTSPSAATGSDPVKDVTIRTPRDVGYFVGDLIRANITLTVDRQTVLDMASLPRPGAAAYWLDLRSIEVAQTANGGDRRYQLTIVYQNFYNALDARLQEIPSFPLLFRRDGEVTSFDVPAWTIGVSPLREVAPQARSDPKDYLRPDATAPLIGVWDYVLALAIAAACTTLCLALTAHDRAWWPFVRRPARAFARASRRLRRMRGRRQEITVYLQALEILHRGIDQADDRSVMADDLDIFLRRHSVYRPLSEGLRSFFGASRLAFFANDPERARREFPFDSVETLTHNLAVAERSAA
jgi:mxaA protein